jgi:hypothetical protein
MKQENVLHTWRTSEFRYLVCPDGPEVAEEIRRVVPAHRLDYDAAQGVWRIRGLLWLSLKHALLEELRLGPVREYDSRADYMREVHGQTLPDESVARDAYETLFLMPEAPRAVMEAAYRALAKTYHPDRSGDARQMMAINRARATILAVEAS